ncbi:MAG: aminotransferase class V-fold PLP-dependent enzyme [Ruminococcus flavefaciens]|nr:aminotransferase class V-fold PLP-dependent enzyme [Ruminococcus flavefaciens]MCM1228997.1 aminotransferase class V-fold PLP-dependent enzyme [Ruminococcus flavefaciens]
MMIINFDNSATTFPKPASVRKAVVSAMEKYGSSGRGGHHIASETSKAVFSARETVADFFNAEPENVVFTLNCTHALNMAIQGIMKNGGHMIISGMEHNSSARPSAKLAGEKKILLSVAPVYPEDEKTIDSFRRLIRSDTKAIVCTIASNVTGQILPYREIAELCRKNDICFIADGAQACGIIDVKMSDGINILCTAGHKGLYGITGTGLLISDGRYFIPPIMQGGTGSSSQSLVQPDLLPESLESGTVGVIGIMSVKAGIEFIQRIGTDRIFRHEDNICRRFISELRRNKKITVYRHPTAEYVPIVSFNIEGMNSEAVAQILANQGFCLRAGFHCSALAHSQLGTDTGTVRFSPSVFSREADAVRLAEAVSRICKK